jgi:hypothetical protein
MTSVSTIYGNLNEEQLKSLKGSLEEITLHMKKIDSEKVSIKDIVDITHDNLKLPKKIISRLAKVYYNQSFSQQVVEDKEFEALYLGVTEVE